MNAIDTIVAPATPVGRSALAIVRIDGPRSAEILATLTGAPAPDERIATHTEILNIDDCVAVRYAGPRSFTGNDLVELTLHGNPLIVQQVINSCIALGARIAEPGEFTERAVLNGKLDLVQAESIADLVNARTPLQAKLSLHNIDGLLSRSATAVREELLHVISRLEAALDFSEEGYEFISRDEARSHIVGALEQIEEIANTFRRGRATQTGLSAVILGKPNAGKSTLLNRLTHAGVLVQDQLFSTLDPTVRRLHLPGGETVLLSDTVGFVRRLPHQLVEAFRSTLEEVVDADLLVHLVDASAPDVDALIGAVHAVLHEIDAAGVPRLLVWNKADLADDDARKLLLEAYPGSVAISAATGAGIPDLLSAVGSQLRALARISEFVVPYERGDVLAALHRAGEVLVEVHGDRAMRVRARLTEAAAGRFSEYATTPD